MVKMRKPNGSIIEVNDNSLPHAKKLGWVEVSEKLKRTRKPNQKHHTN